MAENNLTTVTKKDIAGAIENSTIADSILASFNKLATQGQLAFPTGYNLGNELKLMFTTLSQNGSLAKATPISIGEALAEAVIQGLEIEKNQCYFICYDRKMTLFRSYYGDIAVAKRTGLVKDIIARVIYADDEYELDTNSDGEEYITGHKTKLENRDKPIVGAYAWAELPNGKRRYCIMTMKEIAINWSKSKSQNTQKEFPQEMAKRSVIRRLVKMIFNTSPTTSDNVDVIASFNRTTTEEYVNNNYSNADNATKAKVTNIIDVEELDNSTENIKEPF